MKRGILCTVAGLVLTSMHASAEVSIMPDDLVKYAENKGCSQIEDFFNRPGPLNPPYTYGYVPGPKENSAVFWCQTGKGETRQFFLVVMLKEGEKHELAKCPSKIEWRSGYPGGLEIYKNERETLKGFASLSAPKKKLPSKATLRNNAISSEYDGIQNILYCYKGEWVILKRD